MRTFALTRISAPRLLERRFERVFVERIGLELEPRGLDLVGRDLDLVGVVIFFNGISVSNPFIDIIVLILLFFLFFVYL